MSHRHWSVFVRDKDLRRIALVEDYFSCEAVARFNALGSWSLELDRRVPAAIPLSTPGNSIEIVNADSGAVFLSGPILTREHDRKDNTTSILKVSGSDDLVWIANRVAHPSPGESVPPYEANEHHVVSGTCSTVLRTYVNMNLGPGAIAPRRKTNFLLEDTDPLVGDSVSGKLRWTPLLEELQKLALAGGDIGFRCVQADDGTIRFQVYEPVDRTATIKFSENLGNLEGFNYKSESPQLTYVYVGGQGEGTARTIKEGQNAGELATWGRIEQFEDRRDTNEATELQQKIDEVLAEKSEKTDLSLSPIDTEQQMFGVHYHLGDIVTVIVEGSEPTPGFEGGQIQEAIREVRLTLKPDELSVRPAVGTPGKNDITRLHRAFRQLNARVHNLEAR